MNANQIVTRMIDIEAGKAGRLDPDELRCIRDARIQLQAALRGGRRPWIDRFVGPAMDNAAKVVKAWGHRLDVRVPTVIPRSVFRYTTTRQTP